MTVMKSLTKEDQILAINLLYDCKLRLLSMKFETAAERKEAKRIKKVTLDAINPWVREWTKPDSNIQSSISGASIDKSDR
jgi:hypothetical protein